MAMTTFEKGLQQGQRTMLQKLLEARFGPLSPGAQQRFESLSPERLEALALDAAEGAVAPGIGPGGLSPGAALSPPVRPVPCPAGFRP